jgi:integrase/recombinase XerD
VTLSAFFSWAEKELELASPMKLVPAPNFKSPPVETYSKEQIEAMLKACEWSVECAPNDRSKYVRRRRMNYRDKEIILMLLDTGLRANELCSLKIGDVDYQSGKVDVKHGAAGGAKGGKGRTVYTSRTTRKLVWRYLAEREDGEVASEPLFVGMFNRKLTPFALRHMIKEIGQKAQVTKCYTHRFRHTFAITYLRSGGDVFTLQALLGHGSLEMVQHYARVAQVDVEQAHKRASPVENWRL